MVEVWWSRIPHLSEKMQFCVYKFLQVVQRLYLAEVGQKLSFLLPNLQVMFMPKL